MDAFAGAVGVSDSDGKGTPVYSVCQPELRCQTLTTMLSLFARWHAASGSLRWPKGSANAQRIFDLKASLHRLFHSHPPMNNRHRPLPRLRGPPHPTLHPRQAEADRAAERAEAGHHPPGGDTRPRSERAAQAVGGGVAGGCAGALGSKTTEVGDTGFSVATTSRLIVEFLAHFQSFLLVASLTRIARRVRQATWCCYGPIRIH